ncbi:hypothetical protein N7453_001181 [Penicillium expansum]|nr:hypothetical protein N7453_001181 [Penicillium expansum]
MLVLSVNRLHPVRRLTPEGMRLPRRTSNTLLSPSSDESQAIRGLLELGNQESAKICLKSALNIARCFERLPYPTPFDYIDASSPLAFKNSTTRMTLPRTMPSFACCAMQSSYSMLMIRHRAEIMHPKHSTASPMIEQLYIQLQQGLQSVVGALENYSIAFEALAGMRGT